MNIYPISETGQQKEFKMIKEILGNNHYQTHFQNSHKKTNRYQVQQKKSRQTEMRHFYAHRK
jgi:hypothetical protein